MQQEYKELAGIPTQNMNNRKLANKEEERKWGIIRELVRVKVSKKWV